MRKKILEIFISIFKKLRKKIVQKTENYQLKGWLNSVKEWLTGTSIKISVQSWLQNLNLFRNILAILQYF